MAKSKKNSVAIDEIVKQASLSKKKIYNELKKLEDKVFIKIISNRNDRRKNKIVITSQGKEIVKKLTKEFFRI